MSSLTEQWKNRELAGGWYWIQADNGHTGLLTECCLFDGEDWECWHEDFVKKVICKVPTYEEYQKLYSKDIRIAELETKLQAKEEEIKSLKEDNNFFIKAHAKSEENWEINYNKLYFMLQQAKAGLEFYGNTEHIVEDRPETGDEENWEFWTDGYTGMHIENGFKAREKLEIIKQGDVTNGG